MRNELENNKLYFKVAEDEKNDWQELKGTVEELKTQQETILESVANAEYSFDFKLDKEQVKQWQKLTGIVPLSKKRTRKLLMAKGFDRDSAQMYADIMKPRNMWEINELIKSVGGLKCRK